MEDVRAYLVIDFADDRWGAARFPPPPQQTPAPPAEHSAQPPAQLPPQPLDIGFERAEFAPVPETITISNDEEEELGLERPYFAPVLETIIIPEDEPASPPPAPEKCRICLEALSEPGNIQSVRLIKVLSKGLMSPAHVIVSPDCGHNFHFGCLDRWIYTAGASGNCPLCRCDARAQLWVHRL